MDLRASGLERGLGLHEIAVEVLHHVLLDRSRETAQLVRARKVAEKHGGALVVAGGAVVMNGLAHRRVEPAHEGVDPLGAHGATSAGWSRPAKA